MKIVDYKEFLKLPEGTPFSFGPKFDFTGLLIKEESIFGEKGGHWGFWACDPCGIDAEDCKELSDREFKAFEEGVSYPMNESVSKYMSYDGDDKECFLVFEDDDIKRLKEILGNGHWE